MHAVYEYVENAVEYSTVDEFDPHVRPKSVQLPIERVKRKKYRAISQEPPLVLWRPPSVDRQKILKIASYKMIKKKIAWKKIRYAVARIDCWNKGYHPTSQKRRPLKTTKVFYHPKPYDTWNEESSSIITPRSITNRVTRVEAKPRIDTWLKKPYSIHPSTIKIFHRPLQIQGKSRIDTWSKYPTRTRSTSARV